ncbi:hypothetical protein C0J52_24942 [Blattella germanica]|nr:hypothetical protein C0J52_24942 [Blattella germanica]
MQKAKEPLRGRWLGTRMDSINAVQQQMNTFTHGEENGKECGVWHWQRVVDICRKLL